MLINKFNNSLLNNKQNGNLGRSTLSINYTFRITFFFQLLIQSIFSMFRFIPLGLSSHIEVIEQQ